MNILLTSVGRRSYMVKYFKEALEGSGLVHAGNSVDTYAMQLADKAIITKLIYDESYIDFLIRYCLKNNIGAIIPLFDIDLPILAKNKALFKQNCIAVIVSDFEVTQICNDKFLSFQFLKKHHIKTPLSFIILNKAKMAIENKTLDFPVIIKPRWGMGSIGIFTANNMNELDILYHKTKHEIRNSYLKYESEHDYERCVIIQEKLIGEEYGIDVFNDLNGNFLSCIPKRKFAMRAGETDKAEIIEDKTIFDLGQSLSQKLRHIANLDVDCFKIGNKYFVLEMNCRFGGQYPFSHLAGVNFPMAILNMLNDKPVDSDTLIAQPGITGIKEIKIIIV